MKKLLLSLVLATAFFSISSGQTVNPSGKCKKLIVAERTRINVSIDFTNALVLGMTDDELTSFDDNWDAAKPSFLKSFSYGINSRTSTSHNLSFGRFDDAAISLFINVKRIEAGSMMVYDAVFYDSVGNVIVTVKGLDSAKKGSAAAAGSTGETSSYGMMTRIDAGFYNAGINLGEFIEKNLL